MILYRLVYWDRLYDHPRKRPRKSLPKSIRELNELIALTIEIGDTVIGVESVEVTYDVEVARKMSSIIPVD